MSLFGPVRDHPDGSALTCTDVQRTPYSEGVEWTPENIKSARERAGLTLVEFAKLVGTADRTVKSWEARSRETGEPERRPQGRNGAQVERILGPYHPDQPSVLEPLRRGPSGRLLDEASFEEVMNRLYDIHAETRRMLVERDDRPLSGDHLTEHDVTSASEVDPKKGEDTPLSSEGRQPKA